MRVVVLTGAGVSAESGLPRSATPTVSGRAPGRGRRHAGGLRARPGTRPRLLRRAPRAPCRRRAERRARRAGPARAASAATCCSSPRTSTTCTSAPAARGPAHAWRAPVGAVPRLRRALTLARHARATARPARACGGPTLRPDVVWFGEMPYEMDAILAALNARRPVRLDRHFGGGLPGGGLRAAGPRARRPRARAQPRAQPGDPLFDESRLGPAGALVPAWVEEVVAASGGDLGAGVVR